MKTEHSEYAGARLAEEGKGKGLDQFLQKEKPIVLPYHIRDKKGEVCIVYGDARTIREFREAEQCIKQGVSPEKRLEEEVRTKWAAGHC